MSNFKGHRNAGIVAGVAVGIGLGITKLRFGIEVDNTIIVIAMGATFLFALFPDIDVKSTPSKWFYWAVAITLGYCYYIEQHAVGNLLGLISIIPQLTKHRGIFHSRLTAIILPASIFYLHYINTLTLKASIIIYIASVIGYVTHLFKDRK